MFEVPGYELKTGSGLDRALLTKFMGQTYREFFPVPDLSVLQRTVEQYFSPETPLWWVEPQSADPPEPSLLPSAVREPVGCLWMGNAVDQVEGDRHAHVFLLYVAPAHRRRGIGSALMRHAEAWARGRGDRRLGLQVFADNAIALRLYESLGFQVRSLWMLKTLEPEP